MTKFKKGTFVRWTSKDDDGKFSHVGQVVKHAQGMIEFEVGQHGSVMGVPEDDGSFTKCKKPRNWKKAPTTTTIKTTKPKARRKNTSGTPSKKDQAIIIYRDLFGKGHGKDATIQRFQDVLDMTKAGATTYFYIAKRNA